MKLTAVFFSLLFLCASAAAQAVPDYSGEWVLDAERSDFGGTSLVMRTMKVTQSATDFRVDRVETFRNAAGKEQVLPYSSSLRFGQVTKVTIPGQPTPFEVGIRRDNSAGLDRLIIVAMIGLRTVSEEYWSLFSDGKELFITEVAPEARVRRNLYFYRKGGSPKLITPPIGGTWVLDTARSTRPAGKKMYRSMQMQIVFNWQRFAFRQDVVFDPAGPAEFKSPLTVDIPLGGKVEQIEGGERRLSVGLPGDKVYFNVIDTAPPDTYESTTFELESGGNVLKLSRGVIGGKPFEVLYFTRKK
ncbi:MAG: hypothetical protein QUS14_03635 [Pyrinomonadaceae bacterium]|nr:hypothetical protein [Pyrinomonadaceae bacterium]